MLPKYADVELPLLRELVRRGGGCAPDDLDTHGRTVYESLADQFNLSQADRAMLNRERKPRPRWENMVSVELARNCWTVDSFSATSPAYGRCRMTALCSCDPSKRLKRRRMRVSQMPYSRTKSHPHRDTWRERSGWCMSMHTSATRLPEQRASLTTVRHAWCADSTSVLCMDRWARDSFTSTTSSRWRRLPSSIRLTPSPICGQCAPTAMRLSTWVVDVVALERLAILLIRVSWPSGRPSPNKRLQM